MLKNCKKIIFLLELFFVLQCAKAMDNPRVKDDEAPRLASGQTTKVVKATNGKNIAYEDFSPEMVDYIRLQNIHYLFQNASKMQPLCFLNNLSWQIDGMAVLKRSFRDRSTSVAPIWSALAYLHRGLSLKKSSGEFLEAFVATISPFLQDLPNLLIELEEIEQLKASTRQLMKTLPKSLAKKTYEHAGRARMKKWEGSSKDADKTDETAVVLFLACSKSPVYDDLSRIQKSTLFTHEYKFEKAMEIVETYIKENAGDLTEAVQGREEVKRREREVQSRLNNLNKLASAQSIQRLVGIFYEYESLIQAQVGLAELGKLNITHIEWALNNDARRLLLQTITLLGEAFNNISTPLALDDSQDILSYVPAIKYLRNVLEHPTDYKKVKFDELLANQQEATQVLGGLSIDLLNLSTRLENRLNGLLSILKSRINCSELLVNILSKEAPNKEEKGTQPGNVPKCVVDLLQQAQWQDNGLLYIQWLRRYFYHPTYPINDTKSEDKKKVAKEIIRNEKKSKSKPSDKTTTLAEVMVDINDLSRFVKAHSNRIEFLKTLDENRGAYSLVTNLVTQIFLKLNTMIEGHNLKFYETLSSTDKKLFEIIFSDLRDRRNFSIHDLWRKDLRGLTKIAYLLTYNLQPILAPSQPVVLNDATRQMWQAIYDLELDTGRLEELIRQGADVNAPGDDSWPPLAYLVNQSAEYQDPLVQAFLDHGAQPNQCNNQGSYPLHIAAEDSRTDLIDMLCDAGAIPDCKDIWGRTPEDGALSGGWYDVAMILRGMESRFRGDKADKLHRNLAPFTFDISYLHPISGRCPNLLNADGELPLVIAIEKSDPDNNKDVLEVIQNLLKAGAEINKPQFLDGATPLIAAAHYSTDPNLLFYLLQLGAKVDDVDHYGFSTLHYAALLNKHKFIEILIGAKANSNLQDNDGRTPLLANLNRSDGGDEKTVRFLIQAGSSPAIPDNVVGNAFHYAQKSKRLDILEVLNGDRGQK